MNCIECKNLLEHPVILPCGESICKKHIQSKSKNNTGKNVFFCQACCAEHSIPEDGFPANKALEKFLVIGKSYTDALQSCRRVETLMSDLSVFINDPHFYINDTISLLRNEVEIKREEAKLRIDLEADKAINELDAYELECKQHARHDKHLQARFARLNKNMSELSVHLDAWYEELETIDAIKERPNDEDEDKWKGIKVESEQKLMMMAREIDFFKRELLLNKLHEYKTIHEKLNFDSKGTQIIQNPVIRYMDSKILDHELEKKLINLCAFPNNLEWTLAYQGSRDGFTSSDFHSHCDGLSSTLILIKAACGNVFGGYTEARWDKSFESKYDPNAFVFSLVNRDGRPIKIKIEQSKEKYAIRCNPHYGPIFGSGVGNDFAICSEGNLAADNYSNLGVCYRHPLYRCGTNDAKSFLGGSFMFRIVEIEAFHFDWDFSP